MKLNVGCGKVILAGWVNCDHVPGEGVEYVFDAEGPWPFPNKSVDEVMLSHVLEHMLHYERAILEAHRVLKDHGRLTVRVPYGLNPDPWHVRYFWPGSMDAFIFDQSDSDCLDSDGWKQLFKLKSRVIHRVFWFGWHLQHYLGVPWLNGRKYQFPLGKPKEIVWTLEKTRGRRIKALSKHKYLNTE